MLVLLLLELAGLAIAYDSLIVETAAGPVHGYVFVTRGGENFFCFAGIPYAKPPLAHLRFMPPEPVDPWKDVRQAMEHGPQCPQYDIYRNTSIVGEEDCLYLSVFTKKLEGRRPVMVYIHGGAWVFGDGPRTLGPEYLMDADIVIVDFNSRLGILGYLSMEDSVLPGNMGLKDQVMVLRWVKENIHHFGGDPDRVTLMGDCTGADAVYHHMISPLSTGLFHRAIAESGSSFTVMAVAPPGLAKERAQKIAELMGCIGNSSDVVACLQKADTVQLVSKLAAIIEWQIDPIVTFGPVMEAESPGAFLVGPVSKWTRPNIPLLTGITSGEGLLRSMFFTHNDFDFSSLNKDGFNNMMPLTLMIRDLSSNPNEILPKIKEYYLPEDTITMNNFKNLTDMIGDSWFAFGVLEGAMFSQSDVYMYYMDYVGDFTRAQFFGDKSKATGAFHTDEVLYLWQFPGIPPFKGPDYHFSRQLVTLWTNFIIHGNPTPNDELGFVWTPYKPDENYLALRNTGSTMEKGLLTERYNFWKSLNFRDKLM